MNRILTGLLFSALLISCNNSNNSNNSNNNNNNTSTQDDHAQSNMDNKKRIRLAEELHGEWISDTYLKNIETSKSIYHSGEHDTKLLGFHLDKDNLLTDAASLEGFTAHEGVGGSPIKYDQRNNRFIQDMERISEDSYFPDPFELNYGGDKIIEMYFPESNSKDRYRKADTDFMSELRKILIAGDYKSVDDNASIRLDSDGKVHNFQDFKFYQLMHDFEFGEGIEYDAIFFFKSPEGGNWSDAEIYKFEIVANTLRLQRVKLDDTYEHEHEVEDKVLVLNKE